MLVFFDAFFNSFKGFIIDDSRTTTLNADYFAWIFQLVAVSFTVGTFCTGLVKNINASVFFICEDVMQTILIKITAAFCSHSSVIKFFYDSRISVAFSKHRKNQTDSRGFFLVNNKMFCFRVYRISQRSTAPIVFAFKSSLTLTLHNFTTEVDGIVLTHAFKQTLKNDTFRRIVKIFKHASQGNSVSAKFTLIYCRVISVSRKSVELMDNNHIKKFLRTIGNHLLESRALIGCS